MTLGLSRAATADELNKYRAGDKKSKYYAAIYSPRTIYTARVNQVFTGWDGLVQVTYDAGAGSVGNVIPDMTLYIGTTAGARDVGELRVRGIDTTIIYIDQTSGVKIMDNHYLTIVDHFRLLPRHINIVGGVSYMDAAVAYTNQHALPDPTPIMGSHRVLKMTGASIATTYNFASSYMIDGTAISTKVTTAPTAASISGSTTFTPTVTFDAVGWHCVYLTLTGANGKSFIGVRYVYVWNDNNQPPRVKVGSITGDINSGGWQFDIELYKSASLTDIHEGALVILFSDDYYGDTLSPIGAVDGSENIEAVGWIGTPESVLYNPNRGSVKFSIYGGQYWMQKIAAYPGGVRFKISDPVDWLYFKDLTVDKGTWHFLHWRCTATRILDFFKSGDTRTSPEVSSLSTNLWSQLQEMTALQIFARPCFNAQGQLFIQVHPQLTPEANRTWATVMTIAKNDWRDEIELERVTVAESAQENTSGIAIDAGGVGTAFFSVAPGHTYNHYGDSGSLDKLLLTSQTQLNTLTGLFFNLKNNELPDINILLNANIRLIDIAPHQQCDITIVSSDTPRGIAYSGGLFPKSITVNFDDTTGRATRDVTFEAEIFEGLSVTETIPGSDDISRAPDFKFPPLPVFISPFPGGIDVPIDNTPARVLVKELTKGILYTSNFNTATPEFYPINSGLTEDQYTRINHVVVCPNGAVYAGYVSEWSVYTFLARAPFLGAAFVIIEDAASIVAKFGGTTSNAEVGCFGANRFAAEAVAYVISSHGVPQTKAYYGSVSTFTAGAILTNMERGGSITYGAGKWLFTYEGWSSGPVGYWRTLSPDCSTADAISSPINYQLIRHMRLSTTGTTYHYETGGTLRVGTNNLESYTDLASLVYAINSPNNSIIAADYTGTMLMTAYSSTHKGISYDSGATWIDLSGLPFVGNIWRFAFAGGAGSTSRWLAGSSYLRYSADGGATWIDKQGNLPAINPLYTLKIVMVIG